MKGEQIMTHVEVVNSLMAKLKEYDEDTYGHSIRVCQKSLELAKKMGLSLDDTKTLKEAALLHDIGKLQIPMSILAKPSRLTDEEFAIIKKHAEYGYELAKEAGCSEAVCEAIRDHHERYDGTGYAHRTNVSRIAKILCVADSFDAMISKRRYDAARKKNIVIQEIQNQAGKQFDPMVAQIAAVAL